MARIYCDELRAALSSNIFDMLLAEANESQREMESIDTFNNAGKNELTGEKYDHFREQLGTMKEALSNRVNLATNLNNSIQEALTLLINYMDNYQFLDSSKINEYNTLIKAMAEEKGVVYLNVAESVADENGFLPQDAATDGIHLKKSYCALWLEYLKNNAV